MAAARRPEILAPAGDAPAMRAAVRAGADAVYFGLHGFNARARATNFDEGHLAETMRELHQSGVRGYVTLNTLVFDAELPALEAAVRACAGAGVDAVIVQDLGVARLVREIAPGLAIHASTQMTCTDAAGVQLARSAGATRVILARELSIDDIAAIRAQAGAEAELEVFVHGALCVAYSGQCLTSEAFGGRSANRGACAQACRLPYELVVDGAVRDLGEHAFLLSPEDLEASALVPRLAELGIASLKIEGRLKGPEYVAATTALYRAAVDGVVPPGAREHALQTFTRGSGPGFLGGIDHQRFVEGRACDHRGLEVGVAEGVRRVRGRDWIAMRLTLPVDRGDGLLVEGGWAGAGEIGGRVWEIESAPDGSAAAGSHAAGESVLPAPALVWLGPERRVDGVVAGRRVFRTGDPKNDDAARTRVERTPARTPIDVTVTGRFGEPFTLAAKSARGHAAKVTGDAPVERARAETTVTTREVLADKLGRLGDTPFSLGALEIDLPDDAMIPLSALNRARRALAESLGTSLHARHATTSATHASILAAASLPDRTPPAGGLFVLCRTIEQAHAAIDAGADGIVLDFLELTGTGAALRALRARSPSVPITLAPPRIRKPGEEKIDRYLLDLAPDALLVRSLGALHELHDRDAVPRIGDFSLNVTNRITAAEVLSRGLSAFTPSFDLDAAQLVALCSGPLAAWAEVVVHHPMPLFHMEHCVFAALLSEGKDHRTCGRPCDRHEVSLRDRAKMDHPVIADVGCRNTVFHAAAQSAASIVPALQKAGVRRYRIELVRESGTDVTRIVEAYQSLLTGRVAPAQVADVWRSLKAENGYGVVTGSLRVLPSS
jgi:putative protease